MGCFIMISKAINDPLGSPLILIDEDGNIVKRCEFDPFGNLEAQWGTEANHYLFTGKEKDEGGLYYCILHICCRQLLVCSWVNRWWISGVAVTAPNWLSCWIATGYFLRKSYMWYKSHLYNP